MEVKASVKFCNDLGDAKAYEIPERYTTKRRFEKLMEEYKESVEVAEKARQKYQYLVDATYNAKYEEVTRDIDEIGEYMKTYVEYVESVDSAHKHVMNVKVHFCTYRCIEMQYSKSEGMQFLLDGNCILSMDKTNPTVKFLIARWHTDEIKKLLLNAVEMNILAGINRNKAVPKQLSEELEFNLNS